MSLKKIDENRQFLAGQRKGRRRLIVGVDQTFVHQEERTMKRKVAAGMGRRRKIQRWALLPKLLFSSTLLNMTGLSRYKNLGLVHRFIKLKD